MGRGIEALAAVIQRGLQHGLGLWFADGVEQVAQGRAAQAQPQAVAPIQPARAARVGRCGFHRREYQHAAPGRWVQGITVDMNMQSLANMATL